MKITYSSPSLFVRFPSCTEILSRAKDDMVYFKQFYMRIHSHKKGKHHVSISSHAARYPGITSQK